MPSTLPAGGRGCRTSAGAPGRGPVPRVCTRGTRVRGLGLEGIDRSRPSSPGAAAMPVRRVALLTAGGLAPCLSSAVGGLIERYTEIAPEVEIIGYRDGYHGLLHRRLGPGDPAGPGQRRTCCTATAAARSATAGSSSPTSRTASSADWCSEGQDPLQVAAEQLTRDGVDVLHTIGGDDTNTTAADLAAYLHGNGYELTVVGLPKTIDNDVIPIRQSLGAWTAAEQGARVRPQHHRRAHLQPADAHHPRGDGPQLRLAHRRHRDEVPGVAGHPDVVAGFGTDRAPLGRARGLRARDSASTSRSRGRAAEGRDGRARLREHLPVRGRRGGDDRRGDEQPRRGAAARRLRPRQARHHQPRRVVRQAVRQPGSARRRRWCRRAATSPARRRRTPRTCG